MSAKPPNGGPTPTLQERAALSIDTWKRKLLDLTKRNRLLHFRATKVSTIAVVDELPAEVFRRLYMLEKGMRFQPRPNEADEDAVMEIGIAPTTEPELEEAAELVGEEFVPYEVAASEGRHTDEWLQTALDPESLDRSLRRIDEQARSTIEEQGVNTLFLTLGMLHYVESTDSKEVFRAPLVMMPVQLVRKGARSAFELRAGDDDPMVNPALFEHLRTLGVRLPELPDSESIPGDYDLQSWLTAAQDCVAQRPGWSVRSEIVLGLFSFQKFVMFKDLEVNAQAIAKHRLTLKLVGREADASGATVGLPKDVRDLDLDAEFPVEKTFQVVDADSSQLRAIAACSRGYDLVIEGPPGTGKSQTITNLIASALASGRSVLFVAEKMAALNVVHSRLVAAGLAEFCLELHSSRANKRLVMQDLKRTIDATLENVATTRSAHARLPEVRKTLSEYVAALHSPYGTLGVTPFTGFGELAEVRDAHPVALGADISGVARDRLDWTLREIGDLAVASGPVGVPGKHPWRGSTRTLVTEGDLEQIESRFRAAAGSLERLQATAAELEAGFGLAPIRTLGDVEVAMRVGALIARSPGASLEVLESSGWNAPPVAALRLIEEVSALESLRKRVAGWFETGVLEREHREDVDYIRRKKAGAFGFLAILDGRYRTIRTRWKGYRVASYSKSLLAQAEDLESVDELSRRRSVLRASEAEARSLFGVLWAGEDSDVVALRSYVEWVVEFRKTCVTSGLQAQAFQAVTKPAPDTSLFRKGREQADDYIRNAGELTASVAWPPGVLTGVPLHEAASRLRELHDGLDRGPQWAAFERCRQAVATTLASEFLPLFLGGTLGAQELAPAFRRAFWMKWLAIAVRARPPLERFSSLTHETRVAEFRALDEQALRENQGALVQKLRDAAQEKLRGEAERVALPILQKQLSRQRNIGPLRRTIKSAAAAIRAIKPCFMMSPMTVAQYLDGSAPSFDLVIFDEASQLPTEDAIGAVARGQKLAVVGDPKQLPPTNFFAVELGQTEMRRDEDGNPIVDDAESILEQFMGAGMPMSRLKWHYRSTHESLISFSNVSFYDADLYTFPSIDAVMAGQGLSFEHVPDGVYEGKGLNLAEARRVSDEVVRFAREWIERKERREPTRSLGVGTFNMRQQLAIQDELERRRREDPTIEPFFARDMPEPFFVKNLENIQGDERDVIFISVTYGKGVDGRIRYNFGPINGQNGWRRLNVLVTRARQQMRVFSSMHGEDINPVGATSQGPKLLRDFLTYAEHRRLGGVSGATSDGDSPFEREVLMELERRGVRAVAQVGASGYKIDIGVLDDEVEGRFLCGIECDGAAYHSSETARDRDRLRQKVLEDRGWKIHRVWSTDWFKDRKGQIERLHELIARERERVRFDASAEPPPPPHGGSGHTVAPSEPEPTAPSTPYQRPTASDYRVAGGEGLYAAQDILAVSMPLLVRHVGEVVAVESPVHADMVCSRIAGMWSTKLGKKIRERIEKAIEVASMSGLIREQGAFLWDTSDDACVARSRVGMRVDAEKIAPAEYRAAILAVLGGGHSFRRPELITEVRTVLGMARTGADLAAAIGTVIDSMLRDGTLGEASSGLRLRATSIASTGGG